MEPSNETSNERVIDITSLPNEIQVLIHRAAIEPTANGPRLALVQTSRATNNAFVRDVLNAQHLQDAHRANIANINRIRATGPLGRVAANDPTLNGTTTPYVATEWVSRLGLDAYFVVPARDLVMIGGIRATLPAAMTAPALVLGNEFPNIMLSAHRFLSYIDSSPNPQDPVAAAVGHLTSYGAPFGDLFRSGPGGGLQAPDLPRNFYFFLGPYGPSPCSVPEHNLPAVSGSWCVHHEHLEIAAEEDVADWFVGPDVLNAQSALARNRARVIQIRQYWNRLRNAPFPVRMPMIFFARIRQPVPT